MFNINTSKLVTEVKNLRRRVVKLENLQVECKQSEGAPLELEERYRTIFDSVNDVLILLDKKGKILDANKKITYAAGYKKEELVGKNIMSLAKVMTKKSCAIVAKNFLKRISGIELAPYEVEMFKKSGELMNVEINAVAIRNGARIVGDLAVLRDVSERKRVEQALKESEERYCDLLENTSDLIQSLTPDGHFRYVNSTWRKALGYSDKELSRLTIFNIIHRDYLQQFSTLFQRLLSGEDIDQIETALQTRNGDTIIVDGSVSCKFIDNKPVYTRGIFRDITKRKLAEEQLLRLDSAIMMSTDIVLISDIETRIVDVNDAALEMYGARTKDDLVGKRFLQLVLPENREMVLKDNKKLLENGYISRQKYPIVSKDGNKLNIEMRSSVVKAANGTPVGFVRIGNIIGEHIRN